MNISQTLKKLIDFLSNQKNWCQHKYSQEGLEHTRYCVVGALGHLSNGTAMYDTKRYLEDSVIRYAIEKKLTVDTGKYPLNLATFNDSVPYHLLMAFLNNAFDKLNVA